jgi:organic radical activating enzyme
MPHCSALHNHLCVALRSDMEFSPCCSFDISYQQQRNSITNQTFSEFRNTDFYSSLKKEMEAGWHPGCSKCKEEEDYKIPSRRQIYNNLMSGQGNDIEFIEVSLSNDCNLSCKMCDNVFSSKWQRIIDKNADTLSAWYNTTPSKKVSIEDIFRGVDISKIKSVKYLGGEPFIGTDIDDLIDFLDNNVDLKNIEFSCATNATFFPAKLIDKLNQFSRATIFISIDGIDDLCNYIRTGASWDTVLDVMFKWKQTASKFNNINIKLCHTPQAYNIHQSRRIEQFAKNFGCGLKYAVLTYPRHLTFSVLPEEYKKIVIANGGVVNPSLIKLLNDTKFNPELFEEFKKYTTTVDKILNTDIKKIIPDLYKYF